MSKVYTEENFSYAKANIGDLVSQSVVDNAMNCLPPACMRSDCAQMGEPITTRQDDSGNYRYVYHTFKRLSHEVWTYCGLCFNGENTARGKEVSYV